LQQSFFVCLHHTSTSSSFTFYGQIGPEQGFKRSTRAAGSLPPAVNAPNVQHPFCA